MTDVIGNFFSGIADEISNRVFGGLLRWIYESIYNAAAEFFGMMGEMGSEIFTLDWVNAVVQLFTLLSWTLFAAGTVVAAFDLAVEYQNGRASFQNTALNVLKGFLGCSLIGTVPVKLYQFCISLQVVFSKDLSALYAEYRADNLSGLVFSVLQGNFLVESTLMSLLCMIAFAYSVIKIFFANIKRGGILLIQIAVGSLYMFSVPRGYSDGFMQWIKQVIALCLTAFLQTTLLFLGLMTFSTHMLMGLGIMLAANEVPRIAQNFGLDSGIRVNMMNVVHTATTAVNLTKAVAK